MTKQNKGKQFKLLGITLIMSAILGGCSNVKLKNETIKLELGETLSENLTDYLAEADEKTLSQMNLDVSGVDQNSVGTYDAAITCNGKEYPFKVIVEDTKAPEIEAENYVYIQPGTVTPENIIKNVTDASSTESYIAASEKIAELADCDYEAMLQEQPETESKTEYSKENCQESITLDEEGCYLVTVQTKDEQGNYTNTTLNVYVDATAPELTQEITELNVDASGIDTEVAGTDDMSKLTEMLHLLPEFADAQWTSVTDNFCTGNPVVYEVEQVSFDTKKKNPVETVKVKCSAQDAVGNRSEAFYEIKVTYDNLDITALQKKTENTTTNTATASEKTNQQTSENSNTVAAENTSNRNLKSDEEMINMTPEELEVYLDSFSTMYEEEDIIHIAVEQGTITYYYDNAMSQEVFALVNQERADNGLAAYEWDSNMVSYSDRRAMELVTDFSHNSAGGNWSVGENIAMGPSDASEVMDVWMGSEGHRANILSTVSTKMSISCYAEKETFSNGQSKYYYYWVQNFTH